MPASPERKYAVVYDASAQNEYELFMQQGVEAVPGWSPVVFSSFTYAFEELETRPKALIATMFTTDAGELRGGALLDRASELSIPQAVIIADERIKNRLNDSRGDVWIPRTGNKSDLPSKLAQWLITLRPNV